jgi:DNA-3-methyladenine glycosylase
VLCGRDNVRITENQEIGVGYLAACAVGVAHGVTKRDIRRLSRAELPLDTTELARYLIGKTLVHGLPEGVKMSGRIVETEGYPPGDASGHAFHGLTPGNRTLFLGHGYAYVYFIYGSSYMLNVSSELPGVGAGVLLRALEPLSGIELMGSNRGTTRLLELTRGPGRLTSAMLIDKRYDGTDLCADGPLWLGTAVRKTGPVDTSVRIGITRETGLMLRFYERDNPFVSGPKRLRA